MLARYNEWRLGKLLSALRHDRQSQAGAHIKLGTHVGKPNLNAYIRGVEDAGQTKELSVAGAMGSMFRVAHRLTARDVGSHETRVS